MSGQFAEQYLQIAVVIRRSLSQRQHIHGIFCLSDRVNDPPVIQLEPSQLAVEVRYVQSLAIRRPGVIGRRTNRPLGALPHVTGKFLGFSQKNIPSRLIVYHKTTGLRGAAEPSPDRTAH
jgi:hypothetical protein